MEWHLQTTEECHIKFWLSNSLECPDRNLLQAIDSWLLNGLLTLWVGQTAQSMQWSCKKIPLHYNFS